MSTRPYLEEDRYIYDLNFQSMVVDVGGYDGEFALGIHRKYGCRVAVFEPLEKFAEQIRQKVGGLHGVKVVEAALVGDGRSDVATIRIKGSMTGEFTSDGIDPTSVSTCSTETMVKICGPKIDLMKLNCEGGEFEILESLIWGGDVSKFRHIQVQWHPVVPDCERRFNMLQRELAKTHRLLWDRGWTWQSWMIKDDKPQSQAGQDRFALLVNAHKTHGTFLDIGCGHPIEKNNTWLLEKGYGWRGLCVDNDPPCAELCSRFRERFMKLDATSMKPEDWLGLIQSYGPIIDYLSLDVDYESLNVLKSLPLDKIRFNCITAEHDEYRFGAERRKEMADILKNNGYLIVADQVQDLRCSFEVWATNNTGDKTNRNIIGYPIEWPLLLEKLGADPFTP